jgi:septal ring factor EnvC (AmiA/AmiB activator)
MNRTTRAATILFVSMFGLWGCAQGPTATAQAERIKSLETKTSRLEADYRATASTRDQLKRQLDQATEQLKQLQVVVKERSTERDQLATQYETFRKSIKDLLGQADAAALRAPGGDQVTVIAAPRNGDQKGN